MTSFVVAPLLLFLLQQLLAAPTTTTVGGPPQRGSSETTLYVAPAPSCDDKTSSGHSPGKPLCSIALAIARCCSTTAGGAVGTCGDREVVLLAGTFWLNETLQLSAAHSGLTIRAGGPGRVILSGGVSVTGWQRSPASVAVSGPDIWVSQLPAELMGTRTPRQLYVNGLRATRASGNASEILGNLAYIKTPITVQTPHEGGLSGYHAANTTLAGWKRVSDVEFVYTAMTQPWISPRCRVRTVSPDGYIITMERCLDSIGRPRPASIVGHPWWNSNLPASIENALELLQTPGTFYADSQTGIVYYIPRAGEDMGEASVIAPSLVSLLTANGTANLSLRGIEFEHTSWLDAEGPCGYVPQQAGMRRGTTYCSVYSNKRRELVKQPTRFVLGPGGLPRLVSGSALVSQSGTARLTLGVDGSLCVWVKGAHEPLGYCISTAESSMLLVKQPRREINSTHCVASHCGAAVCPPCCGQKGGAAGPEYTCPRELPLCSGYVANKTFGTCGAGPIACAADHGTTHPCCGQGGGGVGLEYQCPADRPTCLQYVKNVRWGNCEKLGTKGFSAQIVNSSVCVIDRGTNISVFCSKTATTRDEVAATGGPHYLMLSDDGSVCIHSGRYDDSKPPSTASVQWCLPAAWAHPLPAEGENHVSRIPGGVQLISVTNAVVSECSFRHMGGAGLDLWGGVQHTVVNDCLVSDVSATGIQIGSASPCPQCPECGGCRGAPCLKPPEQLLKRPFVSTSSPPPCPWTGIGDASPVLDLNITLEDNVISDVATEYQGCAGVWGGVTVQFRFRHNEICRVPYSGISLGWNWAIPTANTVQRENEISYNRISFWLQSRLADGGATYMLAPQPNSTNHHNFIHDGGSGIEPDGSAHGSGIYPDDGSAYWHIYSNVARNLSGGAWLFAWNDEDEFFLQVHDNYADTNNSRLCCAVSQRPTPTCNWWNNTVINLTAGQKWPDQAQSIMAVSGVRPGRGHIDGVKSCRRDRETANAKDQSISHRTAAHKPAPRRYIEGDYLS